MFLLVFAVLKCRSIVEKHLTAELTEFESFLKEEAFRNTISAFTGQLSTDIDMTNDLDQKIS